MQAFCLSKMISKPQRLHSSTRPLPTQHSHHWIHEYLGIALTNLPDPTACNYLFCSIEPPLSPQNNVIFLCYTRQSASYTSNLITSLYPTIALLYPEIQKTEVLIAPNQHTSSSIISEILASSDSHLQTVMTFNPYNNGHVHQTPTPDYDLLPIPSGIQK